MKARHCGSCRHFTDEDISGDGWCEECEIPTHCSDCYTFCARSRLDSLAPSDND